MKENKITIELTIPEKYYGEARKVKVTHQIHKWQGYFEDILYAVLPKDVIAHLQAHYIPAPELFSYLRKKFEISVYCIYINEFRVCSKGSYSANERTVNGLLTYVNQIYSDARFCAGDYDVFIAIYNCQHIGRKCEQGGGFVNHVKHDTLTDITTINNKFFYKCKTGAEAAQYIIAMHHVNEVGDVQVDDGGEDATPPYLRPFLALEALWEHHFKPQFNVVTIDGELYLFSDTVNQKAIKEFNNQ